MGIGWRDTAEHLAGLLRRRGLDPARVTDVSAAWAAFGEFLAEPVDGLAPEPEGDMDGFIVQCGRYGWNDHLPGLNLTRQLAVDTRAAGGDDTWYQPEYWQVSIDLTFADGPAFAGLPDQDTGFDFSPIGPARAAAIRVLSGHPTLRRFRDRTPIRSAVTLDRAC
jgi:hypothetical protein